MLIEGGVENIGPHLNQRILQVVVSLEVGKAQRSVMGVRW